jgi:hypothetical protein
MYTAELAKTGPGAQGEGIANWVAVNLYDAENHITPEVSPPFPPLPIGDTGSPPTPPTLSAQQAAAFDILPTSIQGFEYFAALAGMHLPGSTFTPTAAGHPNSSRSPAPGSSPKPKTSPGHQPAISRYVVQPADGVTVLASPSTGAAPVGVFHEGTFVLWAGTQHIDARGNQWLLVSGPGARGWVEARLLELHPEGAEGSTGRIDPTLAREAGLEAVTVLAGETLSQIAQDSHVDLQTILDLVRPYIVNPDKIFPGDTVYVPRTAQR